MAEITQVDSYNVELYNVKLSGKEVEERLHREVVWQSEAEWAQDTKKYNKGSLLIYTADNNNSDPRMKVADGVNVATGLPFVSGSGQNYWKSLD